MIIQKTSENAIREDRLRFRSPHCDVGNSHRTKIKYWRSLHHKNQPTADDFSISMREAFALAERQVPSVVVRSGLMGGNPCLRGTRIPVYMILDGVEFYGSLKGVLKSYPQLSIEQVRDAVRFAKTAMEC